MIAPVRALLADVLHPALLERVEAAIDAYVAVVTQALADPPNVPLVAPVGSNAEVQAGMPAARFAPAAARERAEIIRREWPTWTPARDILVRVNAVPGPPITIHRLGTLACNLGVKRPDGYRGRSADNEEWNGERDATLERQWRAGTLVEAIVPMINALPGPQLNARRIRSRAAYKKFARPPGFRATVAVSRFAGKRGLSDRVTDARDAVLRERWPTDMDVGAIAAMLNALPGGHVSEQQARDRARALNLRRPPLLGRHHQPQAKPVASPSPSEISTSSPAAIRTARLKAYLAAGETYSQIGRKLGVSANAVSGLVFRMNRAERENALRAASETTRAVQTVAKATPKLSAAPARQAQAPAPKIAPYVPPPQLAERPPPLKSPAHIKRENDAAAIEAHIRAKGVTRCPVAVLEPTTARVPEQDRLALAAHQEAREAARQAEIMARVNRNAVSKRAKTVSALKNMSPING